MQLNGRMTPFDYKDDVVPHPPVTAVFSNPTQPFAALFAYEIFPYRAVWLLNRCVL